MKQVSEQADFDVGQHDASSLSTFDRKPGTGEFSDRGRADIKVRRNAPRFADNPMADTQLDEFADASVIDRLHQMLTNIPVSDQQIKGGVALTDAGKTKVAARLGISPREVELYLNAISQQLRDQDEDATEAALSEQYYNAVNVIAEDDAEEAGQSDRPFTLHEDDLKKAGYEVVGHPERYFWDNLRTRKHRLGEARYSAEPDALGSVTIRDALTGRSAFIQGAAANRLMTQLKANADHDAILAPLVETLDDTPVNPPVSEFWDEIKAESGSYNFQWKLGQQHGTGTVQFRAKGTPALQLIDVRDAEGTEINADETMRQELLHQARAFIGQE